VDIFPANKLVGEEGTEEDKMERRKHKKKKKM
jgi:hypothetical protein